MTPINVNQNSKSMPFFLNRRNWSILLLFIGIFLSKHSLAQIPLQNINCSPSYVNVYSQGYSSAAAALAGIFTQPKTGINVTTGNTIKQYALVKAGPDSSLGIINYFEVLYSVSPASVCTTALASSRRGSLYRAVNGVCVGNEIQALQNGPNSSTFNYEYVNLEKDSNYIFMFNTTTTASCIRDTITTVAYYSGILPPYKFNCKTVTDFTGSFVANGIGGQTGTVILQFAAPITSVRIDSFFFSVGSDPNFSGYLIDTLTVGQTSISIPFTYDGLGGSKNAELFIRSKFVDEPCKAVIPVSPFFNPDFGVTYRSVPLTGNVKTNDYATPSSLYSNIVAIPGNPTACIPVLSTNGTYTFTCATAGEYNYRVTNCEPAPSTICNTTILVITVLDSSDKTAPPIANPDYTSVSKGSSVNINVRANDKCQNAYNCTLSTPTLITPPTKGSFIPGTGLYTPISTYSGRDSFRYAVCDNQTPTPKCDSEWVFILVKPVGTPNSTEAMDDYGQTPNGTALLGNVKDNDYDVEGNTQTVTAQTTTVAGKGTLVLLGTGAYTFTPEPLFSKGTLDFIYQTCDNGTPSACANATLHIIVEDMKAVFNPDFGVTEINMPLTGNVKTNDIPLSGSTYSNPAANPSNPSACAPVISSNGTYTFVCATKGVYTFYVPNCEGSPSTRCTGVPLVITVLDPTIPNNPPVANPDYAQLKQNTTVFIDVKANDRCQNGPGCALGNPSVVTNPANGGFNTGTGIYTPTAGFIGRDSFKYAVCDNQSPTAKCDSDWVYIRVVPATFKNTTVAVDDFGQTPFGTQLIGNVKSNDTDPEGETQTVTAFSNTVAGKGSISVLASGVYTFTPDTGFNGGIIDFIYTTCDNGSPIACATATLHILVETKKPSFNPDFGVTQKNVLLTGDVSSNDYPNPGTTYSNPPVNPSNPSNCSPTIASNGTYTFTCATIGEYTFWVPVCEPSPSTVCRSIPLVITVVDPNFPIANPDYSTLIKNTSIAIDVRANDRCQNGPGCALGTPTVVNGPFHGTYVPGTTIYTPTIGYEGVDSFYYAVCDNQTPTPKCDSEWVYIMVKPVNGPNLTNALDDFNSTANNTAATGNVKTNDSDPEGNTQTVTAYTSTIPGKGTLTLASSGAYTFTPDTAFNGGSVSFKYTTCDNGLPIACASATLHILVGLATPLYNPDFGVTLPNVQLVGNVSSNDKQLPGNTYSNPPVNGSNPSACIPSIAANGSYTFICATPGEYNFMVPVCEASPSTACQSIALVITVLDPKIPTNPPIANPDYAKMIQNTTITLDLKANDKCQNGPACVLGIPLNVGSGPIHGSFNHGTGVYAPTSGYYGKDSFRYAVCDNQLPTSKCDTEWVYITILPIGISNTTNAMDDYGQTPNRVVLNGNVKTNDTDPEGNTQTVATQNIVIAGKGSFVLLNTGAYTFTPDANFVGGGLDIPYTTCDNGSPIACATATLHILVENYKPNYNPDFGITLPNVLLNGDVSTNDNATPNSSYGNPPANASNPSACVPTIASNGSYTFICATPGEYNFMVPVCEPSPINTCQSIRLVITVLDPSIPTNPPIANPDYAKVIQNSFIVLDIKANDKCQNGPLCLLGVPTIIGAGPSHGTYNPAIGLYTPTAGYFGYDSFNYAVCDNQLPTAKCDSEWVYITILPVGSPNTTNAMDDYGQAPSGTSITGNVKTNDTDAEGNTQTVTPINSTVAGKGTLVLLAAGTYTFTPNTSFIGGAIDFTYTTCDNGAPTACDTATLHILVEPRKPNYNPDFGVTLPNIQLTGNVSTNDNPLPGSTYSNPPANTSNPSTCAPVIASNGSYTFICATPGEYNFMVPVCEPSPSTKCQSVALTITVLDPKIPTNPPLANPDYISLFQDSTIRIQVKANDKCQNGPTCILGIPSILNGPFHGGYIPGTEFYTPSAGYVGKDSFQYSICDNQLPTAKCDSEWVYITVMPIGSPNSTNAMDDYGQAPYGTKISGNVKTNDTDPEGNAQTVTAQTTTIPGKGTLTLASSGLYTFTPALFFYGSLDFPYTTCDNGTPQACATATLHILAENMVNKAPITTPIITTGAKNTPLTLNLSVGTSDPNGDPVIFTGPAGATANANVFVNSNGSATVIPNTGYTGPISFSFTVCDITIVLPQPLCDTETVSITILDSIPLTNPLAPIANDDRVTTPRNIGVVVNVLANDKDPNGDPLTVSVLGNSAQGITATVNADGSVNYTPPTDFVGVDTLAYRICDNSIPSPKCDSALVIITMTNDSTAIPNIAPVAVDDYATTTIGKPVTIVVKINDSDPDGNTLGTPSLVKSANYAAAFVLNPSGTYTYTPDSSFNGNDTFTYSICDNGSPILCDTAMVVISIPCSPYTITGIDSLNPSTCLANDGRLTIKGLIPNVKYNINYDKDGLPNTIVGQKSTSTGQIIINGLTAGLYNNFSISIQFSSCPVTTPLSRKLVGPVPKYVGVKLNCK